MHGAETRGIAAGPGQTLDEALADGVTDSDEHDGSGLGLPPQRIKGRAAVTQQNIRSQCNKLGGVACEQRRILAAPANFDPEVVALRPTELGKRRPKCCQSPLAILVAL